ncbi:hypothetical protein GCM10023320_53810 [Pseudonocardia adelaidensis]|uniref:Uncharacterized protein n=1 Tax=Pseudonocardia adelaidensis TaxID=648754 RepID=A0ABP9NQI9_9PSEU
MCDRLMLVARLTRGGRRPRTNFGARTTTLLPAHQLQFVCERQGWCVAARKDGVKERYWRHAGGWELVGLGLLVALFLAAGHDRR